MAMTAIELFRVIAPEFKDIPDTDTIVDDKKVYGIETFMSLYSDMISEKRFGKLYNKALAYLTAHKLKMQGYGDTETAGRIADALRVQSYSEGETSITFSTGQANNLQKDAEYALTIYGIEFLNIRRLVAIPIISAGEGPVSNAVDIRCECGADLYE